MIKANELRLGNFILDDEGLIAKVVGFSPYDHSVRCDEEEGCQIKIDFWTATGELKRGWVVDSPECNPVPLTPDLLCKTNLVEANSSIPGILNFTGEGSLVIWSVEGGALKYYQPFNRNIDILYLHHLQNVFFALTGEELNVKL